MAAGVVRTVETLEDRVDSMAQPDDVTAVDCNSFVTNIFRVVVTSLAAGVVMEASGSDTPEDELVSVGS